MPLTDKEIQLINLLRNTGVFSEGRFYRMRLFSERERRIFLQSLPDTSAGMLDELEMVQFQVYGLTPKELARKVIS